MASVSAFCMMRSTQPAVSLLPLPGSDHRLMIHDLMGIGLCFSFIDTTGQKDQWHPVLLCIGDDIDGIGETRSDCCEQNTGRAGRMPCAFRHKTTRIFVARQSDGNIMSCEGIQQGHDFSARYTKRMAAACI